MSESTVRNGGRSEPWVDPEDYPLFTRDLEEIIRLGIKTVVPTVSGNGHWTIVRVDEKSEQQPCNTYELYRDVYCFAVRGHTDIPHLPVTGELMDKLGFTIVALNFQRITKPGAPK